MQATTSTTKSVSGIEIPQCSGDLIGEEPAEWPGAPDVFRDLACIAAKEAKERYTTEQGVYSSGDDLHDAITYGVYKVVDKWVAYSGETEETALSVLYDYLLYEVFGGNYTRFVFDQPLVPGRE